MFSRTVNDLPSTKMVLFTFGSPQTYDTAQYAGGGSSEMTLNLQETMSDRSGEFDGRISRTRVSLLFGNGWRS